MEAKEWLDSHPDVMASFGQLFERLVNQGALFPNKEQFKKMKGISGGSVWEFKRGGDAGHRFFCVEPTEGTRWLLTHHYQKGKSKGDQTKSAKLALKIAAEHIERKQRLHTRKRDDDQARSDEN
ncbi:MAG: hypothetical protein WD065_00160 [Planctomycetaceae bacterium]